MLKFKILLWLLTKLLRRTANNNADCARYVKGKNLVFQIQTQGGAGRHFIIENGEIRSSGGLTRAPQFTMTFRDGATGFKVLSAKDSKNAFLDALHRKDLTLSGDFVEIMWFQGLTDHLQPAVS